VELLLAKGADVHALASGGVSSLHMAALGGFEAITRRLLDAGAHIEHMDNKLQVGVASEGLGLSVFEAIC
jgi:ankyrin repeat protein